MATITKRRRKGRRERRKKKPVKGLRQMSSPGNIKIQYNLNRLRFEKIKNNIAPCDLIFSPSWICFTLYCLR